MRIIIPDNKNVTPVVLPCVAQVLSIFKDIGWGDSVTLEELSVGESIVRNWYKPWVDLTQFPYAYYMGDGITKAIDLTRLEYSDKRWAMLAGEYEWPAAFGRTYRKRSVDQLAEEINYLTQPFAGNGVLWNETELASVQGTIVLDMAYISTTVQKVTVLPETVDRVFLGASKTFGTPMLRHGWIFSKHKIPALDMFMNNIRYFSGFGFKAGIKLYTTISSAEQLEEGFKFRNKIVQDNPELELKSDSWLIAYTEKPLAEHLKRGNVYRIPLGLTIQKLIF